MEGTTESFPNNANYTQEGRRGGGERAPRISEKTWESYKPVIYRLWIEEDLVLDEVLNQLKQNCRFSPRQDFTQLSRVSSNGRNNGR